MRRHGQLSQPQVIVSNAGSREVQFIRSSRIGAVPVRNRLAVRVRASICRRRYLLPGQVI